MHLIPYDIISLLGYMFSFIFIECYANFVKIHKGRYF